MADSRRELVLKAVETALEAATATMNSSALTKPTGLTVKRSPEREILHDDLPQMDVWVLKDVHSFHATNSATRVMTVRVRSTVTWLASDESSGDEALDQLLTWAEVALMTDETLGGVAALMVPAGLETPQVEERTEKYAQAVQDFDITYLTKFGDPRTTP